MKKSYLVVYILTLILSIGWLRDKGEKIDEDEKRINSIYEIDKSSKTRKSHQNEVIQELYKSYLQPKRQ